MTVTEAILLGILQGLTEFLPVSSSGHLVIFQNIFGLKQPGITFEILVHFGTLFSVLWVFWDDIISLLYGFSKRDNRKFLALLAIGTLPAGIIGVIFAPFFVGLFQSVIVAPVMLLVTGGLLWLVNLLPQKGRTAKNMNIKDAFYIGLAQAFAIIPGLSRSGSTITAALWRGLDRETAVRYSFLLSLPAVFGATMLEMKGLFNEGIDLMLLWPYIAGIAASFLAGILAIKIFIQALKNRRFTIFAVYCWVLGISVILFNLILF